MSERIEPMGMVALHDELHEGGVMRPVLHLCPPAHSSLGRHAVQPLAETERPGTCHPEFVVSACQSVSITIVAAGIDLPLRGATPLANFADGMPAKPERVVSE